MAGGRPVQVLLTVRPLLTAAVRICLQHKLLTEGAQFCLQAAGPSFAYSPAAAVSSGPDLLTAQVVQTTVTPAVNLQRVSGICLQRRNTIHGITGMITGAPGALARLERAG